MALRDIDVMPGTVSRILWHFTGGPMWNAATNKQSSRRKTAAKAFDNLVSILRSRQLRVGSYSEVVRVVVPEMRYRDEKTKTFVTKQNVRRRLKSSPVCCLADIPIVHLPYHAKRYGRFAIGFHREAAINHGFNPVLYTLEQTKVIQSVYAGLSAVDDDCWFLNTSNSISDAESEATALAKNNEDLDTQDVEWAIGQIDDAVREMESARQKAWANIQTLLAFVKTFSPNEFDSVYCEREWRSTTPFKFKYSDIAMVVVPKLVREKEYFSKFCSRTVPTIKLPRNVPIVPWEDLVED